MPPDVLTLPEIGIDESEEHHPVLTEALAAATRGWHVTSLHGIRAGTCTCSQGSSCTRPGKHPRRSGWQQHATRDPGEVEALFADSSANVGFLTGRRSGLVVLDIDPRHDGGESLEELVAQHGRLPEAPTVLTGGGGQHLYFRLPLDGRRIPSSNGQLGPGLDVRGEGGYVVGPGSLHASGRRYVWEASSHPDDVPLPEVPAWLLALMQRTPQRPRASPEADAPRRAPTPLLRVLDGVAEGQRYISIFRLCCSLYGRRVPHRVIEDLALHAAANCRPPYGPEVAVEIARDVARRYPPGSGQARRPPGEERLAIMGCIAAAAGPLQPADVARALGQPRERVKKMMARMASRYGELVATPNGYLLAPSLSGKGRP